jgi:hypothetical protein
MTQKEITLNGQQVSMIYCAATENGFETISNRSIGVFVPTTGKNEEGKTVIIKPAEATMGDFVTLAMAAIVTAYGRNGQQPPVTSDYILYDATPKERNDLISAIVQIRDEWYTVPDVVREKMNEEREKADENGATSPNA